MGTIFDIQPFALHDGPGIRTTVFLKGCPLRCEWCSNPESFTKEQTFSYDADKCIQCLECTKYCPTETLTNVDGQLHVDHSSCIACGRCLNICPTNALSVFGEEKSADQVISRILNDKAYFDKSGGGITLSGGEPLMQQHFALQILKKAKAKDMNTAVETSGFVQQPFLKEVLPFVDVFLFDYKLTDDTKHRKYTGQSNKLILSNLDFLCSHNARIILRCPIIPEINDDDEHFQQIADLSNKYESIESVELMPYHNYGDHKYDLIGLPRPNIKSKSVTDDVVEEWLAKLIDMNCKNPIRS